jgi:hypothetical protein
MKGIESFTVICNPQGVFVGKDCPQMKEEGALDLRVKRHSG